MIKRLIRSGNSLALVIDRPLLEALEIDSDTELELSTDGDVLVVTPLRDPKRKRRVADLVDLFEWVDGVAAGGVDKAEVSVFLRRNC